MIVPIGLALVVFTTGFSVGAMALAGALHRGGWYLPGIVHDPDCGCRYTKTVPEDSAVPENF